MTNVVTPTTPDPDNESLDSEERAEKKIPGLIDRMCSVRFVSISIVLVMSLLLLLVTAAFIGVYSMTITGLSTTLREQIMLRTRDYVTSLTQPTKLYGQLMFAGLVSGAISPNADFTTMKQYVFGTFAEISSFPGFSANQKHTIYLADVRNSTSYNYIGFTKIRGYSENVAYWPGVTPGTQYWRKSVDANGAYDNVTSATGTGSSLFSLFRPAIAANGSFVTTQGRAASSVLCTVTAGIQDCPVQIQSSSLLKSASGSPLFVQSTTFYSTTLNDQLHDISQSIPGSVLILIEKQTGKLMASSDGLDQLGTKNNGSTLLDATEYGNRVAAEAASKLQTVVGQNYTSIGLAAGQSPRATFQFRTTTGDKIYGDAIIIDDGTGLQWIAMLAVYENAIVGKYITFIIVISVISVTVAILCLIAGIISAFCISTPLNRLVRQLILVQDMKLEEVDFSKKVLFRELRSINNTFHTTVKRLIEYKAFLPSYILTRDFGEEEDDAQEEEINRTGSNISRYLHKKKHTMSSTSLSHKMETHSTSNSSLSKKLSRTNVGTDMREVSVMLVMITNLEQMTSLLSHFDANQQHGTILNEILVIAKKTKGDLTQWNERSFLLTWNATKNLKKHVQECASATAMMKKWLSEQELDLCVKIGAAVGEAFCGTVGVLNKKQFCIYGPVVDHVFALTKLNTMTETVVIINEAMSGIIQAEYDIRPIVKILVPADRGYQEEIAMEMVQQKVKHFENEWMYEMDSKRDKYALFKRAMDAFDTGDVKGAIESMKEYVKAEPNDSLVPLALVSQWEQLIAENKKYMYMEWCLSTWKVVKD